MATVLVENFLSMRRKSFLRLGPRHSVTVTVWFSRVPLQRIEGIPTPDVELALFHENFAYLP